MKRRYFPIALILVSLAGCIPGHPTRTVRPEPPISPWQERTVHSPSSGATYRYLHLDGPNPDAPKILLIHGGIFDHRIWVNTQKLSTRFEVMALEYPDNSLFYTGHVADWGRVITDFVNAMGTSPDYLAGVSNGAYGAIEYLVQNPDNQVKGLALISTVMFASSEKEVRKRTKLARFALSLAPGKLLGLIEKRADHASLDDQVGHHTQRDFFYVRPYPYYYEVFRVSLNQGDLPQQTRQISIPVLVLHGDQDDVMPLWAARMTVGMFPNATLKILSGQGHTMAFSAGNQVATALLRFFKP